MLWNQEYFNEYEPIEEEWHFLTNKDYPPKLDNYVCLLNYNYQVELKYTEENGIKFWLDEYSGQPINIVIAWKYIEEDY